MHRFFSYRFAIFSFCMYFSNFQGGGPTILGLSLNLGTWWGSPLALYPSYHLTSSYCCGSTNSCWYLHIRKFLANSTHLKAGHRLNFQMNISAHTALGFSFHQPRLTLCIFCFFSGLHPHHHLPSYSF